MLPLVNNISLTIPTATSNLLKRVLVSKALHGCSIEWLCKRYHTIITYKLCAWTLDHGVVVRGFSKLINVSVNVLLSIGLSGMAISYGLISPGDSMAETGLGGIMHLDLLLQGL